MHKETDGRGFIFPIYVDRLFILKILAYVSEQTAATKNKKKQINYCEGYKDIQGGINSFCMQMAAPACLRKNLLLSAYIHTYIFSLFYGFLGWLAISFNFEHFRYAKHLEKRTKRQKNTEKVL